MPFVGQRRPEHGRGQVAIVALAALPTILFRSHAPVLMVHISRPIIFGALTSREGRTRRADRLGGSTTDDDITRRSVADGCRSDFLWSLEVRSEQLFELMPPGCESRCQSQAEERDDQSLRPQGHVGKRTCRGANQ